MTNVDKLAEVKQYMLDHPEEVDMGDWATKASCNTTRCLAGTAVFLDGHELNWKPKLQWVFNDVTEKLDEFIVPDEFVAEETVDGQDIEHLAAQILDLSDSDRNGLFYCDDEEVFGRIDNVLAGDPADDGYYDYEDEDLD